MSESEGLPAEAERIRAGYAFTGPALGLGALLWDGRCLAGAPVRIPLPVLDRHGLVAGATGTGKSKTLQPELGDVDKSRLVFFFDEARSAAPPRRSSSRSRGPCA